MGTGDENGTICVVGMSFFQISRFHCSYKHVEKNVGESEVWIYDIRGEDGDIIGSQSDCEDSFQWVE